MFELRGKKIITILRSKKSMAVSNINTLITWHYNHTTVTTAAKNQMSKIALTAVEEITTFHLNIIITRSDNWFCITQEFRYRSGLVNVVPDLNSSWNFGSSSDKLIMVSIFFSDLTRPRLRGYTQLN